MCIVQDIINSIVPLFSDFFVVSPFDFCFVLRYNLTICCPIYSLPALVSECWDCRCVSLHLVCYCFKDLFYCFKLCVFVSDPPSFSYRLLVTPLLRLGMMLGVLLPIHAGILAGKILCRQPQQLQVSECNSHIMSGSQHFIVLLSIHQLLHFFLPPPWRCSLSLGWLCGSGEVDGWLIRS